MLIEFSVENYKSIRERATLRMVASNIVSEDKRVDIDNVFQAGDGIRLLRSAAIYGANASGKSNLLSAISFMRDFVLDSAREGQADEPVDIEPFLFNTETEVEPSLFEMVFLNEGIEYRYGFQATQDAVVTEWLYAAYSTRETILFTRDKQDIQSRPPFGSGKGIVELTRSNALFLSVAAQFNNQIAAGLLNWFRRMMVASGLDDTHFWSITREWLADESSRIEIVELIKRLDIGIVDLRLNEDSQIAAAVRRILSRQIPPITTYHRVFDDNGQMIDIREMDLRKHESQGTRKLVALIAPLLSAFRFGIPLVIDEFDARLHPVLTKALVKLFSTPEINKGNAQIIFATHDTNLLDKFLFRRDQIWFAEKDDQGSTHLIALAEYKVRNTESFERNYILGRYGAIPFLGDLSRLPGGEHVA